MLNKLVFLSALSVVALSGAAQAATFNPGTYTAVSKGNGGEVPVTVTFTKTQLNPSRSEPIKKLRESAPLRSKTSKSDRRQPESGCERCQRRLYH